MCSRIPRERGDLNGRFVGLGAVDVGDARLGGFPHQKCTGNPTEGAHLARAKGQKCRGHPPGPELAHAISRVDLGEPGEAPVRFRHPVEAPLGRPRPRRERL